MSPSWREHSEPLVLGHRGASADAPENTLAAFRLAQEQGADGVELDVQRCASGEVVVIHDDDLQRVAGVPALVSALSLRALRLLDVGSAKHPKERVPTLDEVFGAFPGFLINVEIKAPLLSDIRALCEGVADIVARYPGRALVSSFHPGVLLWYKRLDPVTPLGYLHNKSKNPLIQKGLLADAIKPFAMHPGKELLDREYIRRAKEKGRPVHTWTVNTPEEIELALALGVDALITNHPARARQAVDEAFAGSV